METKKIFFVKIYFLIWEPPAHSFLIESMVPFPDLLWGGGSSKTFFCKNKIMVPLFPPHLSEGGGGGMKLLQKKLFGVQFSLKQIGARQCWILKPTLTWFKLVWASFTY